MCIDLNNITLYKRCISKLVCVKYLYISMGRYSSPNVYAKPFAWKHWNGIFCRRWRTRDCSNNRMQSWWCYCRVSVCDDKYRWNFCLQDLVNKTEAWITNTEIGSLKSLAKHANSMNFFVLSHTYLFKVFLSRLHHVRKLFCYLYDKQLRALLIPQISLFRN